MRGDEDPVHLLVGVVGQREDHPVRPRAGIAGFHHDAAHDPVLARCRGDLDEVAVRTIALDHRRQVDRRCVDGDPDRLDGPGRRADEQGAQQGRDEGRQNGGDDGGDSTQRASVPAKRGVIEESGDEIRPSLSAQSYRWVPPRARRTGANARGRSPFLNRDTEPLRSPPFAAKTSRAPRDQAARRVAAIRSRPGSFLIGPIAAKVGAPASRRLPAARTSSTVTASTFAITSLAGMTRPQARI